MKKAVSYALRGLAVWALTILPHVAVAQSTAPYAVIGYLSTVGCPAGQTVCFIQYGATVPTSGGGGNSPGLANVVTSCGSVTYTAGVPLPITQDTTGKGCSDVSVTVSASISGFQQTSPTSFATITANGTSSTVALPTGTSVVVFNVGSNPGNINLGTTGFTASASTTPIQPGSWFSQTVGSATNLAAYSASGTSFIIVGGAGLPAGAGGGSSGGGGGGGNVNVTQLAGNATATGAGAITSGTLRITTAAGSVIAIDQSNPNVSGGTNDVFVDPSSNIDVNQGSPWDSNTDDGVGNVITSTGGALDVNLKSGSGTNLANTTLQTSGNSSLTSIASSNTTIATNTTNAATTTLQAAGNTSAATTASNTGTIVTNTGTTATNTGTTATNTGTIATNTTHAGTPTLQAGTAIVGKISQVDSAGNDATDTTNHAVKVNIVAGGASNASIGVVGSTAPTSATAMGIKDGSGNIQIPSSTNPVPVTGGVAQGSATAGQTGSLVQVATVSTTPSFSATTSNPLTGTLAGELRVDCTTGCSGSGGGTSSNYGSAFPTAGTAIGAKNGANMVNLAADGSSNLDVNLQTSIPAGSAVIGALTANQSVNLAQVSGTTATVGAGAVSAGAQRVAVGQDTTTIAGSAPGTAGTPSANVVSIQGVSSGTVVPISGTVQIGNTPNTTPILASNNAGGNTQTVKAASASPALTDPSAVVSLSPNPSPVCTGVLAINQTTSTDLHTFTNIGYICSIMLVSASAQNISLDEGTGSVCATSPTALIGGTSASLALAANGGFSMVSDRTVVKMQASADHLCLQQSSSGNVSGVITYQDHS